MTKHVLLNNISHKDLKVKTNFSAEFGDNVSSVLTFINEFGDIQKEYPILFQKDPKTDKFNAIALLGLQHGENLFLQEDNNGWNAEYVPAVVAKGPFLIGFQNQEKDGGSEQAPVIHIDMDNPRLSETDGVLVFLEHGGNSPYLEKISTLLKGIHEGMAFNEQMFDAFTALELIEPVIFDIELKNGEQHKISGNYTINRDKLAALDGQSLEKLNKSGFLQAAYLVIESMSNMNKLIRIKNSIY